MEQNVPKRRHMNFRRRAIIQKKAYKHNNFFRAEFEVIFQQKAIFSPSTGQQP
jgi:hypothetical protein